MNLLKNIWRVIKGKETAEIIRTFVEAPPVWKNKAFRYQQLIGKVITYKADQWRVVEHLLSQRTHKHPSSKSRTSFTYKLEYVA